MRRRARMSDFPPEMVVDVPERPKPPEFAKEERQILVLWFPGLKLKTVNAMLGSGKKTAQTEAKRQSRDAFIVWNSDPNRKFRRFTLPVSVSFTQYTPDTPRIDADNLHVKHLLDEIVRRGILEDDSPRFVHRVSMGHVQAEGELAVMVRIEAIGEGR